MIPVLGDLGLPPAPLLAAGALPLEPGTLPARPGRPEEPESPFAA